MSIALATKGVLAGAVGGGTGEGTVIVQNLLVEVESSDVDVQIELLDTIEVSVEYSDIELLVEVEDNG